MSLSQKSAIGIGGSGRILVGIEEVGGLYETIGADRSLALENCETTRRLSRAPVTRSIRVGSTTPVAAACDHAALRHLHWFAVVYYAIVYDQLYLPREQNKSTSLPHSHFET